MDGAPLLRAHGIGKWFGPVHALDGAGLTVQPGEVVALAGENGSGKSTLARILAGVLRPDDGELEFAGAPVRHTGPREALKRGICLVSQEPTLVPHLPVAENVLLHRLNHAARGVWRRALCRDARPYLARVGLDVDPAVPLRALPAGDRELVEVAKALAAHPRLLILDEATARLSDPERLFGVVESLAAEGAGVVFITHRLREIRRLCDRAVVLRDGRPAAELTELSDLRLSAAMVGRDLTEYFHKEAVAPGQVRLAVDALVTDRSPHPISLTVRAGEIVGVAGLVGAGRSELLETIAGARRPHGGRIAVDGTPVAGGSVRRGIAAGIGLVPEDRFNQGLVHGQSIVANLALAHHRALGRSRRRHDRRRAAAAIARFGIRCRSVAEPVAALSGGNAQKVVLGRVLGAGPGVLLLDEPTRGVDIGARTEIYTLLGTAARDGAAILLASSDLMELIGVCDRIVVLSEGRVAGELPRAAATEEAIALLALGGRAPDRAPDVEGDPREPA